MDELNLIANVINLVTAVLQFATAALMYKAYKREQDGRK